MGAARRGAGTARWTDAGQATRGEGGGTRREEFEKRTRARRRTRRARARTSTSVRPFPQRFKFRTWSTDSTFVFASTSASPSFIVSDAGGGESVARGAKSERRRQKRSRSRSRSACHLSAKKKLLRRWPYAVASRARSAQRLARRHAQTPRAASARDEDSIQGARAPSPTRPSRPRRVASRAPAVVSYFLPFALSVLSAKPNPSPLVHLSISTGRARADVHRRVVDRVELADLP